MANIFGRQVVVPLTNKSGGSVAAGDVVIVDTGNNAAFTTTTSAGSLAAIGVAQETIANNASGRVLVGGYAPLVNVNASVTRGNFGKTHTVAKQAMDAGSSRAAGTFCRFLTGGTTPDAMVYPVDLAGAALTNPMTTTGDIMQSSDNSGTPARLAAPASGKVLTGAGTSTAVAYLYPPGYEFDYVEKTSNTSITGTSAGAADTIVTGASVAYDGATIVAVEFYSCFAAPDPLASRSLTVGLFESSTEIARLCYAESAAAVADYKPFDGRYRFTPSNASHTYIIKAWVSAGTGLVGGGAGGAAAAPAFMRITKV